MTFKKNSKGFTLIELLVVIAIIAILSVAVLAQMSTARRGSRDGKRQAELRTLQLAIESYSNVNNGGYPISVGAANIKEVPNINDLVNKGMLTHVPDDPLADRHYMYISSSNGDSYCLGARLEGPAPEPHDTCPGGSHPLKLSDGDATGQVTYMVGR